jgi:hypothetical protein
MFSVLNGAPTLTSHTLSRQKTIHPKRHGALPKPFNYPDAPNLHMSPSIEVAMKELERHFPQLQQRLDVRSILVIGRLAPRFTGDRDKDMALLRGTIESLYKARTVEALLRNLDVERDYALELVDYARMNRLEMRRLFA